MKKSIRVNFSQVFRVDEKDLERTPCGFLKIALRVSRIGVMEYKNSSGKAYNEYKPPEELFKPETMDSLRHVAVTNKHPSEMFVRPYNSQRLMVGFVCGNPVLEQDYYLNSEICLTRQDIIDSVIQKFNNGENQEVSAGYSATIEEARGDYNGERYDAIQKDIQFNHVALVDVGRAGKEVRLVWPNEKQSKADSVEFADFRYCSNFI